MAKLNLNPADFQNLEAPREYSILPAGEYQMQIVQSDIRATQSGTGHYLWLEFDILKGPAPDGQRKFWDRLNIDNPNEQTKKIANQALLAISNAVLPDTCVMVAPVCASMCSCAAGNSSQDNCSCRV